MKPKKPRKKKAKSPPPVPVTAAKPPGEPVTVLANKQPLTIHPDGFACMVPGSGIRVEVPEFIEINGKTTLQCIDTINTEEKWKHISTGPLFQMLFKDVFEDRVKVPKTLQDLKNSGLDVQHITGMIVDACEAIWAAQSKKQGVRLFFNEPESHLHPAEQRCLMTMINKLRRMAGQKVKE